MREQLGEKLTQADIVESEAKKAPGLELARTSELDLIVDKASQLASDFENDRDIKAESLIELEESLEKMRVAFGSEGETMTIEELKKVPDVAENIRIYEVIERAVEQNKANGITEVTYLTPGIARKLVSVFEPAQSMSLTSLKIMTDEVAEILGQAKDINIRLTRLKEITWRQLQNLFAQTNTVSLRGLEIDRLNEKTARIINLHADVIIMDGKQIDRLKELFSQFQFRRIMGH